MLSQADFLFFLTALSNRIYQFDRAAKYGKLGAVLYPNDQRIIEHYGYALLNLDELEELKTLLEQNPLSTANGKFLSAKLELLSRKESETDSRRNLLHAYLSLRESS